MRFPCNYIYPNAALAGGSVTELSSQKANTQTTSMHLLPGAQKSMYKVSSHVSSFKPLNRLVLNFVCGICT